MNYILEPIKFLLSNKTFVLGFLASLGLIFVSTPLVARLAEKYNVIDKPDPRKLHKTPTPLMGGLAIYFSLWLPIFALYFRINRVTLNISDRWWEILMVALSGAAVMLSGIIDDKRGLNATKKLLVQVPIAYIFAKYIANFNNLDIPYLGEFSMGVGAVPITMLWIIGITNALNLIDGIDGLACGVTLIVAFTNGIIAWINGNSMMALVMLSMSGACLGFLYYNFPPAKIFLGDTGSLMLGMTLATTSVLTNSKSNIAGSFLISIIVLGYPVTDTLLAMVRRRILGKSMFSADFDHIHHRLLAKGIDRHKTALIIYSFCLVLSALALVMILGNNFLSLIALLIFGLSIALSLYFLGFLKILKQEEIQKNRIYYKISHHLTELLEAKLYLAENFQQIFKLLEQAGDEFGFLSVEAQIAPGLINASEKPEHQWINQTSRDSSKPENNNASIKVEKFSALEGSLIVQISYQADELNSDLKREHLLKMRQLVNRVALHIKQLYPQKKETT